MFLRRDAAQRQWRKHEDAFRKHSAGRHARRLRRRGSRRRMRPGLSPRPLWRMAAQWRRGDRGTPGGCGPRGGGAAGRRGAARPRLSLRLRLALRPLPPDLRLALLSSWPGLTRPSISVATTLSKMMDTRVKPAYDVECVDSLAHIHRSFPGPSVSAARKSLHVSGSFRWPRSRVRRGRRNAERRTLVTAAAYFPDRRETEAHGNASRRFAAATSS